MGKKYKNKRNKKKQRNEEKKDPGGGPYDKDFVLMTGRLGNFKMESYYALQGIHNSYYNDKGELVKCQTADEKNQERLRWREAMTLTLPSSFRIAYDVSLSLKQTLEAELEELIPKETLQPREGEEEGRTAVLKKLPFLPHAYQLSIDKKTITKDPATAKLHNWLKQQTQAGFITRQETVSMVPPVILAPEADDVVFDMCAAPGSKTCQILEKLSEKGAIVANDSSYQRAYMLVTQLRRIMHNNPVCLITSCEAQFFPQSLSFDRVLADVPCSGDGTSRKNIGIWKHWNQLGALALHSLQFDIAWKGVALLKVGGYMCYSTCSQNPIENEAVVAELLRRANGSLELVETTLEGFKTRPGISTWKVLAEEKTNRQIRNEHKKNNAKMQKRREEFEANNQEGAASNGDEKDDNTETGVSDKTSEVKTEEAAAEAASGNTDGETKGRRRFDAPVSWDEETLLDLAVSAGLCHYRSVEDVPESMKKRIRASCFPPTEEEAKTFHLEKCLRCLPHDNDTGGFFTVLFKKIAPISNKEARLAEKAAEQSDGAPELKRAKPNPETETNDPGASNEMVVNDMDDLPAGDDADDAAQVTKELKENQQEDNGNGKKNKSRVDNFVYADPKIMEEIVEYYGFTDDFPKDQYMTRACGDSKTLFFIGKSVKDNFIDKAIQARVPVINSGVKGFVRQSMDSDGSYRISQEGVHFLFPYMTKRKISASLEDFMQCLVGDDKAIQLSEFSSEFAEVARSNDVGSIVVSLKGYENDRSRKMLLSMWRCRGDAINCLVSRVEIDGIRSKLAAIKEEQQVTA